MKNLKAYETLVELLRWRAKQDGTRDAYVLLADGEEETTRITYGELDIRAREIAARLQQTVSPGSRALLLYPSGVEYIAAFFGCLYAGITAVPVYPPRRNQSLFRLESVAADSGANIALTTSAVLTMAAAGIHDSKRLSKLVWLSTDIPCSVDAGQWCESSIGADDIAFLQYTSGSTATPKGVMLTHGNLLHNEGMIARAFGHSPESVGIGWLPLYHDMGLIGNVLQPLFIGMPIVLMPPAAFLQRPYRWLQAISRYRGTSSGGPNFAYDICVQRITPEQRDELDLSHWKLAFCGAEPVRAATLKRFADYFAPCGFSAEAFYPCYGLAEASLFVAGGKGHESISAPAFSRTALEQGLAVAAGHTADEISLVGCGRPPEEQRVVIADPVLCHTVPSGQIGEIWIAGPSIAQGYWARSEESTRTFGAFLVDSSDGPFLRTGDLGFIRDDGELFITGRIKDLIIIAGRNHYPQDIEASVEGSHPAIRTGGCAAFEIENTGATRLAVVAEIERTALRSLDTASIEIAVRAAVSRQHELQVGSIALIRPGLLPKTSSGKVQRSACRAALMDGSLETLWRAESPAFVPSNLAMPVKDMVQQ